MQTSRRKFIAGLGALAAAIVAAPVVLEALPTSVPVPVEPETFAYTFQVGDVFVISDRFAINPITRRSTGVLKQFIMTATATADEIAAKPDLLVVPLLIDKGPYRNVSSAAPFKASDVQPWTWGPQIAGYAAPPDYRREFATEWPKVDPAHGVRVLA